MPTATEKKYPTMKELAEAVAAAGGWTVAEACDVPHQRNYCRLDVGDGMVVSLEPPSIMSRNKPERLGVSGGWPRDARGQMRVPSGSGDKAPGITVSRDKTPAQIAADITRRFLPDYAAAYLKAKARADDADAYRAKIDDRAQMILGVLEGTGADVRGYSGSDKIVHVYKSSDGNGYVSADFRPMSDDVEIKGYFPLEMALEIAELIQKRIAK